MEGRTKIILLLDLAQVLALGYVAWVAYQYGPRIEKLLGRAEQVAGKLESAGL